MSISPESIVIIMSLNSSLPFSVLSTLYATPLEPLRRAHCLQTVTPLHQAIYISTLVASSPVSFAEESLFIATQSIASCKAHHARHEKKSNTYTFPSPQSLAWVQYRPKHIHIPMCRIAMLRMSRTGRCHLSLSTITLGSKARQACRLLPHIFIIVILVFSPNIPFSHF